MVAATKQKRQGLIVYKGKGIYWRYQSFKGKTLELHPHFEIIAKDADSGEECSWNDIVIQDAKLSRTPNFEDLPEKLQREIMDKCVAVLMDKSDASSKSKAA